MKNIRFLIDGKEHDVSIENSPPFKFGKDELLSNKVNDIAFNQSWYSEGYSAVKFLDKEAFTNLREGLTKSIKNIISEELSISLKDFKLENYHRYVKSDKDHFKVVSKTRDLFPEDFNFPIMEVIPKFENILGFKLTDINPRDGSKLHIIVRINRPFSNDFNPPHKDIYERFDKYDHIPQFINLWIPICGVTENSSLPVAPSSHLIPESKILRTFEGGVARGNKYRVRMVAEWDGSNRLERAKIDYGQVLFFTSHLIHGLAINEEKDTTRVSLEFRLFKIE